MLFNSAIFPVIHVCELKYNRNFIITLFIHLMKDVACWSNTKCTSWYSLKIAELALNNNHSLTIYSTLKDILWWITFRDGLPVMSDLESDRCLLIAHLLCEYLIVAKLGVVNLYLKVIKLWLACICSCIYLITHYNFNSIILDK